MYRRSILLAVPLLWVDVAMTQPPGAGRFDELDKNKDGVLSRDELPEPFHDRFDNPEVPRRVRQFFDKHLRDMPVATISEQPIVEIATGTTSTGPGQPPAARPNQPPNGPPAVPPGVKVVRDLDYVGGGHERQRLDLYLPEHSTGLLPLVVWVHGGGWQSNSKNNCRPALILPTLGFALASINYRLTDSGPFPIQIEDCRAAVRWLRANAGRYGIDPDRIGAWGPSAGGHLVALLGTAADEKQWDKVGGNTGVSARVQAVCDYYGPTDFLAAIKAGITDGSDAKLLGGPPGERLEIAKQAGAVTYVSRDDPPFLIVQGDQDRTVPLEQSQILFDKLKLAGVDATLLVVKNGKHGNWGPDVRPSPQQILETVVSFFDKNLKNGLRISPRKSGGD